MDHQHIQEYLVYLAQSASLSVLNYHLATTKGFGLLILDQESTRQISDKIQRFLPIAHISQNKNAAYLEVVCDAAITVAEKYEINKRWFYTAVQGMSSMALVPDMYENAGDPVPLSQYHLQLYEDNGAEDDNENVNEDVNEDINEDDNEDNNEEEQEEGSVQPPDSSVQGGAGPKNSRLPWGEPETRNFIDRKFAGESFPAIGARLGRTALSLQNKWRHVSKPDSPWKDYIEQKQRELQQKRREAEQKKREAEGGLDGEDDRSEEGDDSDSSDDSDEIDEDEESDEKVQPAASTADTGTVTNLPAAPTTARGWSDAELRELIKYKIDDGLTNGEINVHLRRPNGSIHLQWVNLSMNPNGKWFAYIHKKYRAKRRREKLAKAARDAAGADAGATGQTKSSVSLLPSM